MSTRLPAPHTRLDKAMNSTVYSNQTAGVERLEAVAEGERSQGVAVDAEAGVVSEECSDHLVVLLWLARAGGVHEPPARTHDSRRGSEDLTLPVGEAAKLAGRAPPLDT